MILECTECRTRYVVPDSAIGVDGRTVRCAACRHSWFQSPAAAADLIARAAAPVGAVPVEAAPVEAAPVEAALASPAVAVQQPQPAAAPVVTLPAVAEPDYDAFAHHAPFRPRRNPAKRWTMMAVATGVAMLAGVIGLGYAGGSGIAAQLGLPITPVETPLRLIDNPIERRDLANGSEMFAISGKVVNPTDTHQPVPDIRAELRDAQGRLVYSWRIRPEAMALPPRGTVEFNSAKLDVPASSERLVLSFTGAPVK